MFNLKFILENSTSFNEAEVRFRILDPILLKLGYPGGDEVYIQLEEKLPYPYFHIGRKSKKKDLPLGFPDYRAGLKGRRGSFIVEAKSGNKSLTQEDVEQAHSYAAHAQVGANYFLLANGTQIQLYETLSGSSSNPVADIPIGEIEKRFHELENILSPKNLAKNCQVNYDTKLKLCDGLGSIARIRSGEYGMDAWEYRIKVDQKDITNDLKAQIPSLVEVDRQLELLQKEFQLRIGDGVAQRDADGRISAQIRFLGATKGNTEAMRLLGIEELTFSTRERFISLDKNSPTVMESSAQFSLGVGALIPQMFGGTIVNNVELLGNSFISALVFKSGNTMIGEYCASADYHSNTFGFPAVVEFDFVGHFVIEFDA